MAESFINDVAFTMTQETKEPEKDDKFDWTDQRRKKYEKSREQHAKYFSPLSALCEAFADSQTEELKVNKILTIEKPVSLEDVAKERDKYWLREAERKLKKMQKQNVYQKNRKLHEHNMNKIKSYIDTSKVIAPGKEKQLNHQRIEAHQEQIIEREEDVPAFKNMPREEYIKEGKTRRRVNAPTVEQKIVHCNFCKAMRRSVKEIIDHMKDIHASNLNELLDNNETMKIQENTEGENVFKKEKKVEQEKTKKIDIEVICNLEDDGMHLRLEFNKSNRDSIEQTNDSLNPNCLPSKNKTIKVQSANNDQLQDVQEDNEVIPLDRSTPKKHLFEDSNKFKLCESGKSMSGSSQNLCLLSLEQKAAQEVVTETRESELSDESSYGHLQTEFDSMRSYLDLSTVTKNEYATSTSEGEKQKTRSERDSGPMNQDQMFNDNRKWFSNFIHTVKKPNRWSRFKQVMQSNIHYS